MHKMSWGRERQGFEAAPVRDELPRQRTGDLFVDEHYREELIGAKQCVYMPRQDEEDIPHAPEVLRGHYHSFCSLEKGDSKPQRSSIFPISTTVYRAVDARTTQPRFVRRLHAVRGVGELHVSQLFDFWCNFRHPNVVGLSDMFVSSEFGEGIDIICVYDYHHGAKTVQEMYLSGETPTIREDVLLSIFCQLLTALRAIHSAGATCRGFHMTKVICCARNRFRISSPGLLDVLQRDNSRIITDYQCEDLASLGNLMLCLGCHETSLSNIGACLEFMSRAFAPNLVDVVGRLAMGQFVSVFDVCHVVGDSLSINLERELMATDVLEEQLARELENGRLFRVLTKLSFVTDRPEWTETGDRYVLKLFRDYLFHQLDGSGRPLLDTGHIVETINKLDVGSVEKLVLVSRDRSDLLVVTFADVKHCLETAYKSLRQSMATVTHS